MSEVFDARATIKRGIVQSINDTGAAQTVTVKTTDGAIYSDIEVWEPFGAASVAPVDGALAVLLAIGGDPANLVAMISNPSLRFGGKAQGEQVIYGSDGSRVAIRQGGTVEILAATAVAITAPNVTITVTGSLTINAPGGVDITGNLLVNGNIHATGSNTP